MEKLRDRLGEGMRWWQNRERGGGERVSCGFTDIERGTGSDRESEGGSE